MHYLTRLSNQERIQQKKGVCNACIGIFYIVFILLSNISFMKCQLVKENTTNGLSLHNLQLVTPKFPNVDYLKNVLSKESEYLWSSQMNSQTILAILYSSLSNAKNMPVENICKKLKYSMTSQSSLDILYWGLITAKQLSCSFKLPQSTIALFQSTLNSAFENDIIIDPLTLKEHEKMTYSFSQVRSYSVRKTSWMSAYKILCILKLSTNSDIFNSSIEQFKTQLSHQIFQVIERNQIFYHSIEFLQLLHVYFSLNINSLHQEEMIQLHRSISQKLIPKTIGLIPFNLQTSLHIAFLDSIARYLNEPSPWISILSSYIEISLTKAFHSPWNFNDFSDNIFFLLALSSSSIQHILLPLSSSQIPFHIMIIYGAINECSKFLEKNISIQSSLCLQLSYCHPCNQNDSCSNTFFFTSPESLQVSFISTTQEIISIPFLKQIKSSVGVAQNPHHVRCQVSNLYDLSNSQSKHIMDALVLRFLENSKYSVSILQPNTYLKTPLSSFYQMDTFKNVSITTEMMDSTKKIDLEHPIIDLPLKITSNINVIISLYENSSMATIQHLFQSTHLTPIGSLNQPISTLQVVLLVEALEDPTLSSLFFSTPQQAARFRPHSSLSAVQLYHPTVHVTDHTIYTLSIPVSKLINDMNLLPTTLIKITALIISHSNQYISSQHVIGTFNLSQSDRRLFFTPSSKEPILVETLNHSFYTVTVNEAFWHPKPLNFQVSKTPVLQKDFSMVTLMTLISIAIMTLITVLQILSLFTLKEDFRFPTFWETILLIYCLLMAVILTLYKFHWTFLFFLQKCIPLILLGIILTYISCTTKTLQECCRPIEINPTVNKNK